MTSMNVESLKSPTHIFTDREIVEVSTRPDGVTMVKFDMLADNGQILRRMSRPVVYDGTIYVSMGDLASRFKDHTANVYSALTKSHLYHGHLIRGAEVEEVRRLAPRAAYVERDVVTDDMEVDGITIDSDGVVHATFSFDEGRASRYRLIVCPDGRLRTIGQVALTEGVHQTTISRRIEAGRDGYSNPTEVRIRTDFPKSIARTPLVAAKQRTAVRQPVVIRTAPKVKEPELRLVAKQKQAEPPAQKAEAASPVQKKATPVIPSITSLLGNTTDNYVGLIMSDRVVLLPVSNSAKSLLGNGPRVFSNKEEVDALVTGIRFFTV